ncbi:hypothetical protein SELMODRAFT_402084 [Selaginella moellendorffii]|uniref:Uncharacterized protein n=1 Tax=Selaginella moellendorffii TaxID=88036 RepID=D8QPJ0_SELML|nr:hypothetical protein SELMODRAFT_402084 [Selaginella moellendorffii]
MPCPSLSETWTIMKDTKATLVELYSLNIVRQDCITHIQYKHTLKMLTHSTIEIKKLFLNNKGNHYKVPVAPQLCMVLFANVLFLESPTGVGFSDPSTSITLRFPGDNTARGSYMSLERWLEQTRTEISTSLVKVMRSLFVMSYLGSPFVLTASVNSGDVDSVASRYSLKLNISKPWYPW